MKVTEEMVSAFCSAYEKTPPGTLFSKGVRAALEAALTQAAEPVAWTQPSQIAILAEFEENGKHTSAEMWNKRDPNVMREFYRVNGCEDEFPDDIPLYTRPSPPCDSRTEALEEALQPFTDCVVMTDGPRLIIGFETDEIAIKAADGLAVALANMKEG